MAKVELKKPIVEEISANIADAQGVVLVNYSGLTVAQDVYKRQGSAWCKYRTVYKGIQC